MGESFATVVSGGLTNLRFVSYSPWSRLSNALLAENSFWVLVLRMSKDVSIKFGRLSTMPAPRLVFFNNINMFYKLIKIFRIVGLVNVKIVSKFRLTRQFPL